MIQNQSDYENAEVGLTKPAQELPEAELAQIVPRPDAGVGGNPLVHTELILKMRREHPINSKLIDATRAWG